jgi:predicted small metal-binding protein
MFEFVCDRIIPGCTHVERGDTREKVLEQGLDHLRRDHDMDYIDEPWEKRVRASAIFEAPPN